MNDIGSKTTTNPNYTELNVSCPTSWNAKETTMAKLVSKLNPRSPEFVENTEHMQAQVDDLKQKLEQIKLGGGEKSRERHISRGKL